MNDTVLTALIMAAASVVCQLLINASNRRKREVEEAVKDAHLQERLKSIEDKLDEHNGYASKFGDIGTSLSKLTTAIAVIENEIKHLTKKGD